MIRPYLTVLFLSSCAVAPPVADSNSPSPKASQTVPVPDTRKEGNKPKPRAAPPATSTAVQAPVPPPPVLPTVEHCAKLEAGSPKATVRAKLDCLNEAAKK